ncbi:MAG: hypothetical protein PF542_05280 [Nanoarchaeota archaeon]|jgi:hypothetical protein|nr:hypothetical protein [Nanoarchaeota archaeon]
MKKIGSGCQFEIFDLENGRVLRKPLPDDKIRPKVRKLWWWFGPFPGMVKKQTNSLIKIRQEGIDFFKSSKFDKSIVANLEFKDNKIFQDKVLPIHKIILKDLEKDKHLIDSYCDCLINCMKNGFLEREYNFSDNYGIDKNGNVVLIDFGEVRFKKEDVMRDIKKKRWRFFYLIRPSFRGSTRRYYKRKMKELLTVENLDKYWKKNL